MAQDFVPVVLERAHGYIMLVAALAVFINAYGGIMVGQARKKYDVPYPQMYAELSHMYSVQFNCIQRAHQNFLENMPFFYVLLFTSSIYHPTAAAILGFIRAIGFVLYIHGYSTGVPENRLRGAIGYIGYLGALGLTIEAGLRLIFAW